MGKRERIPGGYPLFVHDDGAVRCYDHLPVTARHAIHKTPRLKEHWTPRGTWEGMDVWEYKQHDLSCDWCRETTTKKKGA